MSILEKLYNGAICPIEHIIPENSDYRSITADIGRERDFFTSRLTPDDQKRFEEWNGLLYEYEQMSEYANFSYGFKMGFMLAFEIWTDKGRV